MPLPRPATLRIAANAIADGCTDGEVYTHVERASQRHPAVGVFLCDLEDPKAEVTREETIIGLLLAADYIEQRLDATLH